MTHPGESIVLSPQLARLLVKLAFEKNDAQNQKAHLFIDSPVSNSFLLCEA